MEAEVDVAEMVEDVVEDVVAEAAANAIPYVLQMKAC